MKFKNQILKVCGVALAVCVPAMSAFAQVPPAGLPLLQETVPGSFLVFPKFDISGDDSTQLRIVNNDSVPVSVKLNFVCPGVKHGDDRCRALDRTVTFTPHQTRIIDVADQNPPCNEGYVIAYAMNPLTNTPMSYNWLTGSYNITCNRELESEYAISVQSTRPEFTRLGSGSPTSLSFGAGDYSGMPSNLFTDFRATTDEAGSKLTLLTLDILAGAQNPAALANIDFWNAAEEPFSSSIEFVCWTQVNLEDVDANFREENLGTSQGSMRITGIGNCPIPGACPPNPNYDATMLGAIQEYGAGDVGGRLLTHDDVTKSTSYRPR